MHNDVVKSDIHSTDTGGYSEILFGAMHLLGFAFAPRIKNFAKCQLYAFQKRKGYEQQGYKILPDAYIGLDHGVGHFRPLSLTRQRHLVAYHGIAMSHEGM